jgi:Carboxypeptidase regulatory-like domain
MKRFALLFALTAGTALRAHADLIVPSISVDSSAASCVLDDDAQATAKELSRTVTGSVFDPSGAAIPGAAVTLTSADGQAALSTITDGAGVFRFEHLAHGTYVIHIQAGGFREAELNVSVGKKPVTALRSINLAIASRNETVTVGAQDSSARITTDVGENQNAISIETAREQPHSPSTRITETARPAANASHVTCPRARPSSPMSVRAHTLAFISLVMTDKYKVPNPCASCHSDKSTT